MTKQKRLTDDEILMEIYRQMFKEAEPSGNIDEMIKTGEAKERDFFMKYYLPDERQQQIIKEVCKRNGINTKHKIQAFGTACDLGSAPTAQRDVMLRERKMEEKMKPEKNLQEYGKIWHSLEGMEEGVKLQRYTEAVIKKATEKIIKEIEKIPATYWRGKDFTFELIKQKLEVIK